LQTNRQSLFHKVGGNKVLYKTWLKLVSVTSWVVTEIMHHVWSNITVLLRQKAAQKHNTYSMQSIKP